MYWHHRRAGAGFGSPLHPPGAEPSTPFQNPAKGSRMHSHAVSSTKRSTLHDNRGQGLLSFEPLKEDFTPNSGRPCPTLCRTTMAWLEHGCQCLLGAMKL